LKFNTEFLSAYFNLRNIAFFIDTGYQIINKALLHLM
jgi:hypothetical protein